MSLPKVMPCGADERNYPCGQPCDCFAVPPVPSLWTPDASTRHPLSERFHQLLDQAGHLHDQKQQDYGRENDPFANVRGSQEWGIEPWKGAMIRANDKIKRIQKYAQDGELANEGVQDSFMDLAVYAIIALVLWEESQK